MKYNTMTVEVFKKELEGREGFTMGRHYFALAKMYLDDFYFNGERFGYYYYSRKTNELVLSTYGTGYAHKTRYIEITRVSLD
jgi:hypothetical protein